MRRSKLIPPYRESEVAEVGKGVVSYPEGFHIHPKVAKASRTTSLRWRDGKRPLDYGMAEALAFGSLLKQGVPVRLTGQDSRRGTFNQRHAALIDIETKQEYVPLEHLATGSAWCEIYNSTLSEASVLGFEYGFSRDFPEALVLVGSAVRRFRERRANHNRSVHRGGRRQMEFAFGRRVASAARLRRPGSGAFQRAHRTIPSACRARQYSDLPAIDAQRNIFICCAVRRCAPGANRWSSSRRRACCAILRHLHRSAN